MSMLDATEAALNAAIAAHTSLRKELGLLTAGWHVAATESCPDYPDCGHENDSEENENHGATVILLECAEALLEKMNMGKICVKCDKRIALAYLDFDVPERCIHCKDPG